MYGDLGEVLGSLTTRIGRRKTHSSHPRPGGILVAKRKGDVKKKDELGFVEKYLQSSIRKRMESFEKKDDMASKKELEPVPPVSKS
ncbi:ANE_G0011580.mRNA.1.CDS.1 [Saccharomyces cerevisiae]|nr:ANE_G0011580.mRNA.1.CDS.1 [Saccharomyces cerevisiae]CAI6573022.1 ANE_G0011580.mRNA.1.CDS.1 [Saccharomyces cerevisiae]